MASHLLYLGVLVFPSRDTPAEALKVLDGCLDAFAPILQFFVPPHLDCQGKAFSG